MPDPQMTPERWKRVNQLLNAAYDLQPDRIPEFLESACGEDRELRQEVEELLAADANAKSFIEFRPLDREGEANSGNLISILTDQASLFHQRPLLAERYRLISKLGKGGMGEVWHAYDMRLRVDVALKSLHLDFSKDATYVELLRKEVRTAREVVSPNVCRIFDLVVDQDVELISMEFIDGTTLSDLLGQSGPLELKRANEIAAQFLAGLEAIHQAGLVHRDLKPENIMITRTGRVVVMDFGISQRIADIKGRAAGTLPYISPELLSDSHVDGRSDIFAAGVVLAEMIHTKGGLSEKTRPMIWNALRVDPQKLPDSPWKPVILRAVATNPEHRFENVRAMMRALEEATQQTEGAEERRPYPGLASFTSANAEYFFDRELQVETIVKKMQSSMMLAVIGPSGAGKTSFLRAGVIPALPKDWFTVFTTPGDAPVLNLTQSLSRSIGNANHFQEPDAAVSAFQGLRKSYQEIVLIIDRFEELFTLNASPIRVQYAEIIGRLSMEANVRVILGMRDDFLICCEDHESLRLIFSELTPILPLKGADLRRALVQPALKCGYRFEDENMVDQILSDVQNERGALPLIAFAAARLWDKRDHKNGVLTRQAYKEIGGVSGALAQYAEKIFEQKTPAQQTIVREIFRNLVTAQNTRAARDWEELVSIFENKGDAEEVLRTLVDARLVTSFDAPSGEASTRRRVEIVHESLLTAWPRLVRWQTQDADAAQMRDQLRQASQLWEQRNRSEDLLWTGASFLEYQTWRERYAGRLTATEEAFAHAMAQHAGKKRRQRKVFLTAAFVTLLTVLAAITMLWRNASMAKDQAFSETKIADARRVIAIARSLNDLDASTKLAYAIRSLEFADNPEARLFAMQAIAEGPIYHALIVDAGVGIQLSPDGKWLAAGQMQGGMMLFPRDGSKATVVNPKDCGGSDHVPWHPQFSPNSEYLLWTWRKKLSVIKVWSVSQKKLYRQFEFEGLTLCMVRGGKAFFITDDSGKLVNPFGWHNCIIRTWNFGSDEPKQIGRVSLNAGWKQMDIDPHARWIAYPKGDEILMEELQNLGKPILIGKGPIETTQQVRFNPNGKQMATGNGNGDVFLWDVDPPSPEHKPVRTFPGNGERLFDFWFDPGGTSVMTSRSNLMYRWDLSAPVDAEPMMWRITNHGDAATFDKSHHRMILGQEPMEVYDYASPMSYVFHGKISKQSSASVRFTPDGKSFIAGFSEDGISMHPLPGPHSSASRSMWNDNFWTADSLDLDPSGKYIAAPTEGSGLFVIPTNGGTPRQLKDRSRFQQFRSVTFSNQERVAAINEGGWIEIWDLAQNTWRTLARVPSAVMIRYSQDGTLFLGDNDGSLKQWNSKTSSFSVFGRSTNHGALISIAFSNDGRTIATTAWSKNNSELRLYDLQSGKSSLITSHGNRVTCVTLDRSGTKLVTGDADGIVRVGSITGETPHLLLGHQGSIRDVAVSPDGKWVLSAENSPTVRLWRMPQGKPIQELPTAEFLNTVRKMTNVRVVTDETLPIGFRAFTEPNATWGKK